MAPKDDHDHDDDQGQGGSKTPTMGDVRTLVREEIESAIAPIKDLLGKGGGDDKTPAPAAPGDQGLDLGAQIDKALDKVLGDRDRKTADDAHAASHARLDAMPEVKPVDRPRRSRWLGNIWDN